MPKENLILVGVIQGAFGVKGEIRLKSFTQNEKDIFKYAPFLSGEGAILFEVKSSRAIKDGFAFYTKNEITREQAQALRNTKLYVPREKLPPAAEDEFYHVDLIGLRAQTMTGEDLGVVTNIITAAGDLLEISNTPNTKKSWLLPFTMENVPIIDIAKGHIICDVPDGLIEFDPPTNAEEDLERKL